MNLKLIENEKLRNEWNRNKNKGLNIEDFTLGSNKKVGWNCSPCGSEYESQINNRGNGKNCPFCSGKKVNETNSLASLRPDLLKYWDYSKNGKTPHEYTLCSGKKVWLTCDKLHSYESEVRSLTKGSKCPYCLGVKVCKDNCLATLNPEIASEWNIIKNVNLTPNDITCNSNKKVWWECNKCGGEWESKVNNRNNGNGCPYCAGIKATNLNSFETTHPKLLKYWDYNKNDKSPSEYTPVSGMNVWWICDNGHSFKSTIAKISYGKACPYCNSFAYNYPELAKEWHPTKNGKLTPYDVANKSGKEIWWICEHRHEWTTRVEHRTRGVNCPYCMGKRADTHNNLEVVNPILSSEWYYDMNDGKPKEYLPYSNKKVWWQCKNNSNHIWESVISDRSGGSGCPTCNESKGEKRVRKWLEDNNITFEDQKEFNGLLGTGGGNLSYDFFLPEYNLLIEYQGEFHDGSGSRNSYTKINLENQQEHDNRKKEYAEQHNIKLLEVWYWDFDKVESILQNKIRYEIVLK